MKVGVLQRTNYRMCGAITALVCILRLRFLFTPISADEGGYLAIARAWGRGAVLYRDVWVDRPQGLLVIYRALTLIGVGNPIGVRVLGVVACIVGSLACGSIAKSLVGERAGWYAAIAAAILTSLPQIEGFIANAELLSGALGACALAVALRACWARENVSIRLLIVAGIIGGCSLSVKQSGFDALGVALLILLLGVSPLTRSARMRFASVAAVLVGFLIAIGLLALHGALTGWHRWWYAIAGYRASKHSLLTGADWSKFRITYDIVSPVLWPIILVISIALFVSRDQKRSRILAVISLWVTLGTCAFLLGGLFHRHYWVILMFPLGTAVGVMVSLVPKFELQRILFILAIVVPLTMTASALMIAREDVGSRLHGDSRLTRDEEIATWFEIHSQKGDQIYAMCASAALYGNISADPPFPYLWYLNIQEMPGVREQISEMLNRIDSPKYVAMAQSASNCDSSGAAQLALDEHYHLVDEVLGIQILQKN